MTDPITAWSTFGLAVFSLVAVGVSYWGIKKQTESFAMSVSADLCLKLTDRFDSEPMIKIRNLAARALMGQTDLDAADDIFDFFETVGLYVRKNALDKEIAHSMFFHWVNLYWHAGRSHILKSRERSSGIYADFENLYNMVLKIEMRDYPKSRDINPTEEEIIKFLKQETTPESSADTPQTMGQT
jgi:hypothetical protein